MKKKIHDQLTMALILAKTSALMTEACYFLLPWTFAISKITCQTDAVVVIIVICSWYMNKSNCNLSSRLPPELIWDEALFWNTDVIISIFVVGRRCPRDSSNDHFLVQFISFTNELLLWHGAKSQPQNLLCCCERKIGARIEIETSDAAYS